MTVVTIAITGIVAVLLAVSLKGMKGEYGTYLVMAAGFFIFFYGMGNAGYGAVGTQIEIFGKLSVLAVSMPILLALIETLQVFLS